MLKHIDVFLGVALVMLGISLLITIVTQLFSFLTNLRGRELRRGLSDLFVTLSTKPGVEAIKSEEAKRIATQILEHPLVAEGKGLLQMAAAISRADLLRLIREHRPEFTAKLQNLAEQIEDWFDASMTRISNRFTFRTRQVTVVAAILAAFGLQLDSFGLVKRLYADADLRAGLVGATGALLKRAEEVLGGPGIHGVVAAELARENPELKVPPSNLASREQAQAWILGTVSDKPRAGELVTAYDAKLRAAIGKEAPALFDKAAAIHTDLELAGFSLLPPRPYRPWHFDSFWAFLGVLASAALLSLGAPFWFNVLKTVSNLRPVVARQVDARSPPRSNGDDQEAAPEAGPAGPGGKGTSVITQPAPRG